MHDAPFAGLIERVEPTRDGQAAVVEMQGASRFVALATGRVFPRPIHPFGALADGSILAREDDMREGIRIRPNLAEARLGDLDTRAYLLEASGRGLVITPSTPDHTASMRDVASDKRSELQACEANLLPTTMSPDGSMLIAPAQGGV
jgi:hypothetical protein